MPLFYCSIVKSNLERNKILFSLFAFVLYLFVIQFSLLFGLFNDNFIIKLHNLFFFELLISHPFCLVKWGYIYKFDILLDTDLLAGIQINFLHVHRGRVTSPVLLSKFLFSHAGCVCYLLNLFLLTKQSFL